MRTMVTSKNESDPENYTPKIGQHIAVLATNTENMKETGFGSMTTCRSFSEALKERYQRVTFHDVTSTSALSDIVKEAPDLVVLTSKYFLEKHTNTKTWFSQYFADRGIAYTGSNRVAMELDSNKSKAKTLVQNSGLATAKFFLTHPDQFQSEEQLPISLPVFIKPLDAANSNGIDENSIARDFDSYRRKVAELFEVYGVKVLVEELLPGREFTVAILNDKENATRQIIPMEITPPKNCKGDRTLGGEAKRQNVELVDLVNEPLLSEISLLADQVFTKLGARDFGRIDIKLDADDTPHFLEANLAPGMTPDTSYFPRAYILQSMQGANESEKPDMQYSDVAQRIVELALSNGKTKAAM